MSYHSLLPSPIGEVLVVGSDEAVTGLWFADRHAAPDLPRDARAFTRVASQLEAYWAGDLRAFDIPLAPVGTPWQRAVWSALADVPYGTTLGYGELAARVGHPAAARAVGAANGRNPISVVIPCHRLVGSTGSLVKYGGGIERKRWLLAHEGATGHASPRAASSAAPRHRRGTRGSSARAPGRP